MPVIHSDKFNSYYFEQLGENVMPVGIYCSPHPPIEKNGISYPSKITDEQFAAIKECGINVVYGHDELFGTPTEEWALKAMEYCDKYNLVYMIRAEVALQYIGNRSEGGKPLYATRPESEKKQLADELRRVLRLAGEHKSFGGILFVDEPGEVSFEGIAAAKKVFDEVCPDKLFLVNNNPYNILEVQYMNGVRVPGYVNHVEKYSDDKPHGEKYFNFLRTINDCYHPEVYSYDMYPFGSLGTCKWGYHEAIYELPQICLSNDKTDGVPYWIFVQCGGYWEKQTTMRVPTMYEVDLSVNSALAFGAKGIQLFPYCYPNCWIGDEDAIAGLINEYGEKTFMYGYFKKALRQVTACGKYLMHSRPECMLVSGKYENALVGKEEMSKILWEETVYKGVLPKYGNIVKDSHKDVVKYSSDGQTVLSCFSAEKERLFYIFNTSTQVEANAQVEFADCKSITIIKNGEKSVVKGNALSINLDAGAGALIVLC